MDKPRKAYLLRETAGGMGFQCSPCVVLTTDAKNGLAWIRTINFNATSGRAWLPPNGESPLCVRVSELASSRIKALAKIALRLHDLDIRLSAEIAMRAAPIAPAPAARLEPARPTMGGPRRTHRPWYEDND